MLFKADNSTRRTQPGLTRRDAAYRLGVSISTVRRMEGGDLHPVQDERGVWRFELREVELVASEQAPRSVKRPNVDAGQIAARVFEAFQAGYDLSDIVIELRVHPSTVRELYSQWSIGLEEGERERRHELELAAERREQRELERLMRPRR